MTNWSVDALEKKNTTVRVCVREGLPLFGTQGFAGQRQTDSLWSL